MFLPSSHALQLFTDAGTDVVYFASGVTDSGSALTPYANNGVSNSTTPVDVVVAGASPDSRMIEHVNVRNGGTVARTLTVQLFDGTNTRVLRVATLAPGDTVSYSRAAGWAHHDAQGRLLQVIVDARVGNNGFTRAFLKTGTASDAVAYSYCYLKDAGLPGAITVGTPGINGRAVSNEAGTITLPTPTGSNYLTRFVLSASVAHLFELYDLLWINTGIVVTTTGAQAIVTPTLPARDNNDSTNGEGCMIGLLVTTVTTNAGAISNATVTYTNSDGVASRTATLTAVGGLNIPASAVVGTIVWFQLAAGDKGVRSIESISLGTSLVTGAVSLVIARKIDVAPVTLANVAGVGAGSIGSEAYPGVKLATGASLFFVHVSSATTATAIQGVLSFADR